MPAIWPPNRLHPVSQLMSEPSPFSLRNKVIVQCGASGLLGPALLHAMARAGATLVAVSRTPARLEPVAAAIREKSGSIELESVNLTSESNIFALRDRVVARHGRIDGAVFNSVARTMVRFDDPLEKWEESMRLNATGFFAFARAFGDAMQVRGQGSLVNIASMQGMIGMNPALYEGLGMTIPPDYFFHKGGMINLTRHLASHYGHSGVRVNSVSPGGIHNPERPPPEAFHARYKTATMLGRMANADEIGGAVVFLLSDAASYITGANLPVDGGYTAK
jgi:NAD(P)-dependent dehydrogenase (short-subunit alcohol dehydrogenase family)